MQEEGSHKILADDSFRVLPPILSRRHH